MPESGNVKRFSASLPPALIEEFDETWMNMKYENRSKAIHDALRKFITDAQLVKGEGLVTGVILALHYLDKPRLFEEVSQIQHRFRKIVASVQQLYIEDNKVLQIIAVTGKVNEVEEMRQGLTAMKGVKQVKTSFITK